MADCPYEIPRGNLHDVRRQASLYLCALDGRTTTIEYQFTITTVTGIFTALDETNGVILCDASANAMLIVLPSAASLPEKEYTIKKIDSTSNAIAVVMAGVETIDDETEMTISIQYDAMKIKSDGSNWHII